MDSDFEQWARARTPWLLRAAYVLTGDQHAAEDLAQGALEKVAGAWSRIDNPDAYVRQVLHRLQIRTWRRPRFRESPLTTADDVAVADETAGFDLRVSMGTALARLTPRQRAVIVLRFYDDLSEADAAAVLGCSVGTVKSQTHKALEALRRSAPELTDV